MRNASGSWSDSERPVNMIDCSEISDDQGDVIFDDIEDENRIWTPPPRIAARFYKPTNNRRKTSAASSRRNSISSIHSHQSHASSRSYHGAPQSNVVAQHLRRASILEDRKARLADRAAHAEKVRLRAALAKAAPRSTSNSEERALAAQQAREKNLAEIVASCAEEVKRAKGIAESMKEKREAEGKKLRRDMEERLAEAERRRAEMRKQAHAKRGRSISAPRKSLSPMREVVELEVAAETISQEDAAHRIQRKWRSHRRYKCLKAFSELGLSIEGVRDTSFEDVTTLLAMEKVLLSTASLLQICGLREGESGSVNEMTAVRTFLSAFLVLGHPTQVLSNKGDSGDQEQVGIAPGVPIPKNNLANPQIQDLVAKARDLLISFENVISRLTSVNNYTPPPAQQASLSDAYKSYFNAFIAWKARDSSTMVDMMVAQFVELDAIWQTVKDSTEEAVVGTYRDGIRENQMKLMLRIKKLAGPARGKQLITNAIREARKSKAKKPSGDSKPRVVDAGARTPVLGDMAASDNAVKATFQTLTPPATPRRHTNTNVQALKQVSSDAEALRSARSVLPENRQVVHELMINKEYLIELDDCLEQRGPVNRAMFDSMRLEIAAGNSDQWVLAMAENIKGKLQHLLTPGNSLHTLIGENLDLELITRQLSAGSFSYERFFSFMTTILPRLCAPVRDTEVQKLVELLTSDSDVVDRLESLMRFIDIMQLDYANYMLSQGAPELVKHAVSYEQMRFSENLEQGVHSLDVTEHWWAAARTKVYAEAARRDPENVGLARNRPTPDKIYFQLLVDLFTDVIAISPDEIPETLRLDSKRIIRIRRELLGIVTTGAILLQSKNILKRDVRAQWKTEAPRIMSVLSDAKSVDQATQGICAALESSRAMPSITRANIRDVVRRIVEQSQAAHISGITEPVMRLLMTRLRGHIIGRLAATSASEKVRLQSTASEGLAGLGLPEFVGAVGKIVEEIGRVGSCDRESHALWYEQIYTKVEEMASKD